MTKILFASDIHVEFGRLSRIPELPARAEYDHVLLIGDIGVGTSGIDWALDFFPADVEVTYIPGNHEYYRNHFQDLREKFQQKSREARGRLIVLDPSTCIYNNEVLVIGATLWSALRFTNKEDASWMIERSINDFRMIVAEPRGRWDSKLHTDTFRDEVEFIQRTLTSFDSSDVKIVVATHFLPTQLVQDPRYEGSPINPYFASDLDFIMENHKIDYWLYGHSHSNIDIEHPSGTKILSNQFGYPGENKEPNKWRILDL